MKNRGVKRMKTRGVNRHWFHDSIRLQLSCHDASQLYQIYFAHFIKLYKLVTS